MRFRNNEPTDCEVRLESRAHHTTNRNQSSQSKGLARAALPHQADAPAADEESSSTQFSSSAFTSSGASSCGQWPASRST